MSAIFLTVFVSLVLAGLFVLLFVYQSRNESSDATRDSLMPLEGERPARRAGDPPATDPKKTR